MSLTPATHSDQRLTPSGRYQSFFPEGPENSDSFARIVSEAHATRIKRLLDNTKGTVVLGGQTDVAKRYIAPTVVRDVTGEDSLMSE